MILVTKTPNFEFVAGHAVSGTRARNFSMCLEPTARQGATFKCRWLVQPSLNSVSQNGTSTRLEPKVMAVLVCLTEHTAQ